MSALLTPTKRQIEYQDWEFGIFIHFGIRTFFEGHQDFDGVPMSVAKFNPENLDCRQWCEAAVAAGAKYMVFTAKHHDGFCNWPSKYTDYSVNNTPWKSGRGDVVKEFTQACREYNLKVGLYYSPADMNCPCYENPEEYDDYFINQVSELLDGSYGDIDLLWLDGCGTDGHQYNWKAISQAIRKLQPDILIHSLCEPDYHWCGNEEGISSYPVWNVISSSEKERLLKTCWTVKDWLPQECPCRIREKNWFYSDHDLHTLKSLEELAGIYEFSVGRGCNLLLNVAPNRQGLFPEPDTQRLQKFGTVTSKQYSSPIAVLQDAEQTDKNVWEFQFDKRTRFKRLVIAEDQLKGQHIKSFRIEVNYKNKATIWPIFVGQSVGHKAICSFPFVAAENIIFRVTESFGKVTLKELSLYN